MGVEHQISILINQHLRRVTKYYALDVFNKLLTEVRVTVPLGRAFHSVIALGKKLYFKQSFLTDGSLMYIE